jgi:hypothetical protein
MPSPSKSGRIAGLMVLRVAEGARLLLPG